MIGSSRSGLSSRAENTSADLYGGLGLSDENGAPFLNASGVSQVGQVAGNSKAVLAALRALQDKIRRLDTERAHAIDEAAQLRQQCKALELEVEHAKQRETLSAQRTSHEARVQQERWYSEKAELEVRLARAEDRIRDVTRAAAEAEAGHRALEEGKRAAEDGERRGEERARALEEQLAQAVAKERGWFSCSLRCSALHSLSLLPSCQSPLAVASFVLFNLLTFPLLSPLSSPSSPPPLLQRWRRRWCGRRRDTKVALPFFFSPALPPSFTPFSHPVSPSHPL